MNERYQYVGDVNKKSSHINEAVFSLITLMRFRQTGHNASTLNSKCILANMPYI